MDTNVLILYNSQRHCIDRLTMEQRGRLLTAIWDYEINGTTDVDDDIGVAFDFLRAAVDADAKKYNEICEMNRAKAMKRWNATASNGIQRHATASNINNDIDTNDNIVNNTTKKEERVEKKKKAPPFVPPTPAQVKEYAEEKGYKVDAEAFCDHYASNGWKVGNAPMKDWEAAVRSWAKKEQQFAVRSTPHGTSVGERAYNMLHFEYEGHPEKWEEEEKKFEEFNRMSSGRL